MAEVGATTGIMNAFKSLLFSPHRLFKITKRIGYLYWRLAFPKIYKNWNEPEKWSQIPQPAYCNTFKDLSILRFIKSNFWVEDLNSLFSVSQKLRARYNAFDYDSITKAFYPTKNSAMESINQQRIWETSYFNPSNTGKLTWARRQSDALFADMMTNTQGVYKARKLRRGTPEWERAKKYFSEVFNQNREHFGFCNGEDVLEELVCDEKYSDKENDEGRRHIYWMDYEPMRWVENDPEVRASMKARYKREIPKYEAPLTSSVGNQFNGYIEIPFALFTELPNYAPKNITKEAFESKNPQRRDSFVCVGAVFNERHQVYHPFDNNDLVMRDKWQLAKAHIANTDNNQFIIKEHLGTLHYASAIYTTAFSNAAKAKKEWEWLIPEFVETFSYGFLQINFLANLTLIDHDDPIAEKTLHLRAVQSVPIINRYNHAFNILKFTPHVMGDSKQVYQSDAVKMSKMYYDKLASYIDYLFKKYEHILTGEKGAELGAFIYRELGSGAFDGVPKSIANKDTASEDLKLLMKNLIYLWVVHHGETFSIISVGNAYYFVPTFMRKPLSQVQNRTTPLTDQQKQEWLAPLEVWNDSMALSKQVTYRDPRETIISKWNVLQVDPKIWRGQLGHQHDFEDHWNDISLQTYHLNHDRTFNRNLFNLHWLDPSEMPNALNI